MNDIDYHKLHVRNDSYRSVVAQPLVNAFGSNANNLAKDPMLNFNLSSRYVEGGIYARVVDLPSDDTTARGVRFNGFTQTEEHEVNQELKRLKVFQKIAEALKWAKLYGGGALMPIFTGRQKLSSELKLDTIKDIDSIYVLNREEISTYELDDDIYSSLYQTPLIYLINYGGQQIRVHRSRIIPIAGDLVPRQIKGYQTAEWAGRSDVVRAYAAIDVYQEVLSMARSVLNRKQQAVYKMSQLREVLENSVLNKKELDAMTLVQQRISNIDSVRNLLNSIVIDVEDEFELHDMSLTGLRDIIDEHKVKVCSEADLPVTLLFEQSARGMNATGEGDRVMYYDRLERDQRNKATPAFAQLMSLILEQDRMETLKKANWSFDWNPLESPNPKQVAEAKSKESESRKFDAEFLVALVENAILTPEQAGAWLKKNRNGEFNIQKGEDDNSGFGVKEEDLVVLKSMQQGAENAQKGSGSAQAGNKSQNGQK